VWGHRCQRLFLEAADFLVDDPANDGAAEEADEAPPGKEPPVASVVSLYAPTIIRMEETMHLHVYIHDYKLLAHLDSGSNHNFTKPRVMSRLVANGDWQQEHVGHSGQWRPCGLLLHGSQRGHVHRQGGFFYRLLRHRPGRS
jgi:hypothetical protein